MEHFEKRFMARTVAYLDLTFSIFVCLGTIGLIYYLTSQDNYINYYQSNQSGRNFRTAEKAFSNNKKLAEFVFIHLGWILVVISVIYSSISLLGAIALFKATKVETKPYTALRNTLLWRNLTVVFIVVRVMAIIIVGVVYGIAMTFTIVNAIIYGIFLYIIIDFERELEQVAKLPTMPTIVNAKTEKNALMQLPSTLSKV